MIKRFSLQITLRIVSILIFCLLFAYFMLQKYWFTMAGSAFLIALQVYLLILYVNQTNFSLSKFIDALKYEDFSAYFSPTSKGDSFQKIYNDFNLIIGKFKQNKIEKEAQHTYFKYILEHVNLGIISIKKEDLFTNNSTNEIMFLNQAASKILQQPQHKYWYRLAQKVPWLVTEIKKIANGGKVLVDYGDQLARKQLSLEVIELTLIEEPYLIITFQDIRMEIEQKEIEAWHNVIRILAHEMLNSFTPVSSLASTIKSITEDENGTVLDCNALSTEDLEDINAAATTIQKRSEGLLAFVKDYRTISNIPVPKLERINVKSFLEQIKVLMETLAKENQVELQVLPIPPHTTITADAKQIEQIMINLINNSFYALQETPDALIQISCTIEQEKTSILVHDNGNGIDQKIMNQVFIPFYTTKKNGSGVGLSLSKSIMKKHGGNLIVSSEAGKYTTFSLVFRNGVFGE
jgi:nitrogen fixation/metabolism regulation signal transduction histidine kinase